ncbi:MAG: DUF5336 domain-containing protein [Mycobacterium sp.]
MTYSNVPGGYGAQQPPSQPNYGQQPQAGYGQPGFSGGGPSMATITTYVVIAFGVLAFLLGFAPYKTEVDGVEESGESFFETVGVAGLIPLLVAALVAGLGMLPKQTGNEAVVAALSVSGFLALLLMLTGLGDEFSAGVGLILVLVVAFLQAAVAVASLLVAADIIKPRPPNPYGGYYQQAGYGQHGQPGGFGQPGALPPAQPQPQQPSYGAPPQQAAGGYGQGYQQH